MNENTILHKANTRGGANHGWLVAHHSFSFNNYYNPERMHFGTLRVLNDDCIAAGMGFGTHAHDNMEIITIPLEGDLEHKDSMGNTAVIKKGDVQILSAGTGIEHSEYNKNADQPVKLLQIWVYPNIKNIEPSYNQISLNVADRHNKLQQIVSPYTNDEGVHINQNAWFYLADFDANFTTHYAIKDIKNGVYIFNISGEFTVNNVALTSRDGFGIWNVECVEISAQNKAEFLIMEVPMV